MITNVQIEMEERRCHNCGGKFRVLKQSKVRFCNALCQSTVGPNAIPHPMGASITPGPGDRGSRLVEERKKNAKTIAAIIAKSGLEKKSEPVREERDSSTRKEREPIQSVTTVKTGSDSMRDVSNGLEKTESAKTKGNVRDIVPTSSEVDSPNDSDAIVETRRVSLEELQLKLNQEGLASARLLKDSANKLINLMDECVKPSDLEKSKDGVSRVEAHKIMAAVSCANALTATIQAQVKMLTVLRSK